MADDIVTRLRCIYTDNGCGRCTFCLARAEIKWLRNELAKQTTAHNLWFARAWELEEQLEADRG